jgi:hypothetical protein
MNSMKLEQLRNAATEIKSAFEQGLYLKDPEYYYSLGKKHGQSAHEIFRELDPDLPWAYVQSRAKSIEFLPDDLEFWLDEQAVLVLSEILNRDGYFYACA